MWAVHADSIPSHMTVATYLRRTTDFEEAIKAVSNPELEYLVAIRDVPGVVVPSSLDHWPTRGIPLRRWTPICARTHVGTAVPTIWRLRIAQKWGDTWPSGRCSISSP